MHYGHRSFYVKIVHRFSFTFNEETNLVEKMALWFLVNITQTEVNSEFSGNNFLLLINMVLESWLKITTD